jgi:glycosyltransferase involved in cell wall biosynthesis
MLMDADLQHPPEAIPEFLAKWYEGFEVIYGVRRTRETDGPVRRLASRVFYRLFRTFSPIELPRGAGDFRLFDRKALDALNRLGERVRFTKGLYSWIGFRQTGIPFEVAEREQGTSSFNARRLFGLAFDGLTAFTMMPLRIWSYIGLAVSIFAFAYALIFLTRTILFGVDVPGYPSLIISVMFFSGIQLLSLGVLGEYLGRIFIEVKGRPLYFVAEEIAAPSPLPSAPVDVPGMRMPAE